VTTDRRTRRRVAATVLVMVIIVGAFVVRLIDIQVVRAADLATEAEARRSIPQTLQGLRGDIVDRNGVALADSVYRYDITVSPRFVGDYTLLDHETGERQRHTVWEALTAIGELTDTEPLDLLERIESALEANPNSDHAYLVRRVPTDVFQQIRDLRVPWVYSERIASRTYPNGQVAGNLVGFLGTDGPQTGLELRLDECLSAVDGSSTFERGADGVRLPGSTVVHQEPLDGGTLHLTIDSDLQWFAQQALAEQAAAVGADWATAMVVRVRDGHIIAAADWPTVDPNNVDGTNPDDLGSRIFSWPYEPGSTMKSISIAAMFDAGVTTPAERVSVPARYDTINGWQIRDAWAHDGLSLTTAGILMNSSNIGTSLLGERLSFAQRERYFRDFGFGDPTAVSFLGEESGIVRPADSIDGHGAYMQLFGQSISVTSAQMAQAYQAIANGGVKRPLTLVTGCERSNEVTHTPTVEGTRVISQQAAQQTVQILESVVTDGFVGPQLTVPGYRVAAKTGTAEVPINGVYTSERIVSVAGMAPAENPEFVVVVTLGKPDTMKVAAAAAPPFQQIMTQVLKTYRVAPSTQPPPRLPTTW
jgi:cell division protein FtsI (penicillin-binding protein 3)